MKLNSDVVALHLLYDWLGEDEGFNHELLRRQIPLGGVTYLVIKVIRD